MRGKGFRAFPSTSKYRITPAYAGKRFDPFGKLNIRQDHPRLCGEKSGILRANDATTGSPPPMRGKVCYWVKIPVNFRITPAYAGKSASSVIPYFAAWDHPRLCGEKDRIAKLSYAMKGSPPPMRGKVFNIEVLKSVIRITPAYAGKRSCQTADPWTH